MFNKRLIWISGKK